MNPPDAETKRLREDAARRKNWKRWGPYLSERQWGTVREDYSPDGSAWTYFPHDHARSRAYRWGEDGLLGITDRQCRLCFSLALWNGNDPILKERLFGLTGPEGNHGEDVKELYYYLDATPTHSYLKALYKYPQAAFPYEQLVRENRSRNKTKREFELIDTGVFAEDRYFDVTAEYAKGGPNDILIRITIANRGPDEAMIHLLPTLWYRNTWSWGCSHEGCEVQPHMALQNDGTLHASHPTLGKFIWHAEHDETSAEPPFLLTHNHTNTRKVFGYKGGKGPFKDAFHDYVIAQRSDAISANHVGTKAAAYYQWTLKPGEQRQVRLRLHRENETPRSAPLGRGYDNTFAKRIGEADAFYDQRIPKDLTEEERSIARQSYAGLLWTKQFYHYIVDDWLEGDADQPAPPPQRKQGRNHDWRHLYNRDVISMPDKWEYPWYAAWDLAFHMLSFAKIDPDFAKDQLRLFLREWYMHPNGQIPAYEFALGDVNPPVHAWACWRVYKMSGQRGERDFDFLASVFQKLLINFTWWVNRKDLEGNHLFSGGFLGLDNIGVFDRSAPLPISGQLHQADGTAWMAFYCATMLSIAIELASEDPGYEDMASKFFEHYVHIADAINHLGGSGLWDERDGFYYDKLHDTDANQLIPLRVRSLVGLVPLMSVEVLDENVVERLPNFGKRLRWFLKYRSDLAKQITWCQMRHTHGSEKMLLAIPTQDRLCRVLRYMLDENEFLSPFGIRSLSRIHAQQPFHLHLDGNTHSVQYVPGESDTYMFGGNSNWRGPIWFPLNFLMIEALERYHYFFGDSVKVECPVGSGNKMTLLQVSRELCRRLTSLFEPDNTGRRPCHGYDALYADNPHFKSLPLFYEFFHGDTGRGLGASHQTGWTALVTRCYDKIAKSRTPGGDVW